MSLQAQAKKPAPAAANDGGVPHTAWRAPQQQRQQQQGVVPPALRLISMNQQKQGKVCL